MASMLFWQFKLANSRKIAQKVPICKLQFKNNEYQDKEERRKNKIKISYVSVRYLLKSIRDRLQFKSLYI
jgi:hypothetical protein